MPKTVRLVPVVVSAILLAAHFMRAGSLLLVLGSLAAALLVLLRRPWVRPLMQVALGFGALEWMRTLVVLVQQRQALHQSWDRLAFILILVALLTAGSVLLLQSSALRNHYAAPLARESKP